MSTSARPSRLALARELRFLCWDDLETHPSGDGPPSQSSKQEYIVQNSQEVRQQIRNKDIILCLFICVTMTSLFMDLAESFVLLTENESLTEDHSHYYLVWLEGIGSAGFLCWGGLVWVGF